MTMLRARICAALVFPIIVAVAPLAQTPTYAPVGADVSPRIAALRTRIESGERDAIREFWTEIARSGAPLIEPVPGDTDDSLVTFVWRGDAKTRNVVIFDGVAGF